VAGQIAVGAFHREEFLGEDDDVWPKQTNTDKEAQERSSKSRIASVGSLSLLL
jgi:hypothetical protein